MRAIPFLMACLLGSMSGCLVEQIHVAVRAPSSVHVTSRVGAPVITVDRSGGPAIDGESLVENGRIVPLNLYEPTYHAVGGNGFTVWERDARLRPLVRVSDHLEIDSCLLYFRGGHCGESITTSVPRSDVLWARIERRPNRALGGIAVVLSLLFTSPAIVTIASDPSRVNIPLVSTLFALAAGPLAVGLWHLLAPSRERTVDLDALRSGLADGSFLR